jgi:futalosine hydrolase
MKILFVGATCFELHQFFENLRQEKDNKGPVFHYKWYDIDIDLIVTGIGMTFTTFFLTKALHLAKYDLVINAGIAGSFRDEISIGTVVNVGSEQFCDFGIEEVGKVKTVFEAGFVDPHAFPFVDGRLVNPHHFEGIDLPIVNGVTGNICHGDPKSIRNIVSDFDPDIESMEGAAVFYVCLFEKVPFLEIRAISNYVELRDTDKWDIPATLENLTDELFRFLRQYATVKQLS